MDISATDAPLIKDFWLAYQSGDIALAEQLFNQIPNNTQKVLTASKLNKYQDAITNIEQFYKTDIKPYVTQKQIEWQSIVDLFAYNNVYNPTQQYEINNYVSYTLNGATNLYICYARPPVNTAPSNTNYWRQLTVRGVQGVSGVGMAFMYSWLSTQPYSVQDIVSYDNSLWGCIVANTNQPPFEGSNYWKLIFSIATTIYPVQPNQPTVQTTGELWFEVI
ncbi:MAG: hypothetical protein RSF81_07250 [Oscillospiraceae bacterium]